MIALSGLMRSLAFGSTVLGALLSGGMAEAASQPLRFVLIPKVAHPWFEVVRTGADAAALMIKNQTTSPAVVEYLPPARSEVGLQAEILQAAIRSRPSGITIDLLDAEQLRPLLEQARRQGIAVNVFDSEPPASLALTSIGNDYCLQARIASERLVQLLGGQGEVAIMQGVPSAPNHAIRARCHQQVFALHPGIKVVASPIDNDSISSAEEQARATMASHPGLRGWVVSDAGGGIGVGRAIKTLAKMGSVKVVALDDLPELLQLIRSGVVDSTAATKPFAQGYWAVINLWQQGLNAPAIQRINTGISVQGEAAKQP